MLVKHADKLGATEPKDVNPLYFGDTILYPSTGEPFHKAWSPVIEFYFIVYGASDARREASIEVRREDQTVGSATVDLVTPDASGRIQHAGALPLQSLDTRAVPFTVAE